MRFTQLAITDPAELVFGSAPASVTTTQGITIGAGKVVPELNFTLPQMAVNEETRSAVIDQYRQIVTGALSRCRALHQGEVILEFETLLEMTLDPTLGVEIVSAMREICDDFEARDGTKATIRLTPNDTRDFDRPVKMRSSARLEPMLQLFEEGARAGGDLLSIESTGGKELHDDALMYCNTRAMVFSLAVLGVRDMSFLWAKIVDIAGRTGRIAGGDTACGFANTAMVLAEKQYIPRVVAAVDRVLSVVRTLVAVEAGATGPDKDCGYEGPYIKAITGTPISMEGKTAACAHLSPVGNVAGACCDLWSNESVTNTKLLSDMAPTVYLEQLVYDTRLFNSAIRNGSAGMVQQLLVDSDTPYDPQAVVLAPKNVIAIADAIVQAGSALSGAVSGAAKALQIIREAGQAGQLRMDPRENEWVTRMEDDLGTIPADESAFVEQMLGEIDQSVVSLSEYGL